MPHDLVVALDFLSRLITLILAVGAVLGAIFRKAVGTWIETRFKAKAEESLEKYKGKLAESLEEKKAILARELEQKKAELSKDLERDKMRWSEEVRHKAYRFDKNTAYYETFDSEFGAVITELYALPDYVAQGGNDDFKVAWRKFWVFRAHKMLMDASEKLRPLEQYIDPQLKVRVAKLFADLSRLLSEEARDKKQIEVLSNEKGLIAAELHYSLTPADQ